MEQTIAKINLSIRKEQKRNALRKQAASLNGRAGFFGLFCFSIALKPRSRDLKEAKETGTNLLKKVNECLKELWALKAGSSSETINTINELRETRNRLQRMLRGINILAKKKGQKK